MVLTHSSKFESENSDINVLSFTFVLNNSIKLCKVILSNKDVN